MNEIQMRSLIKVSECGSFSKAEESLFLTKQAIKKQIDSLEQEVGFSLLIRTHKGIVLTPAGEEFCRTVRKVLDEMDATTRKCRELVSQKQTIRIAAPHHPRLLLENAFAEFFRRFPYVNQQIILQSSAHFIDDILKGNVDVAELTYRTDLERSGLQYLKLFPLPYKCLVAPSHPLAGNKTIRREELVGNHVGIHEHDHDFLSLLSEDAHDLSLETMNNDIQKINNICYNGGIFISKAYFLNSMQPLTPVPLETDLVPMAVVVYKQSPAPIVEEFLNVIRELYPQEDTKQ
jgi:DNA-binding transcriptional LysR family regulator